MLIKTITIPLRLGQDCQDYKEAPGNPYVPDKEFCTHSFECEWKKQGYASKDKYYCLGITLINYDKWERDNRDRVEDMLLNQGG